MGHNIYRWFFVLCLQCYIVYLGAHSHGPSPTFVDLEIATYSHYDLLGSILGSQEKAKEAIIYSYNRHINGFAALLEEEEAADIAKNPNVVSVFLSKEHKLHTTRSWEFLGLHRNGENSAWQKGRFGENTIIGNIDTGVWPESQSFNDKGFGPIPSKWRGANVCQINKVPGSKRNPCNSVDMVNTHGADMFGASLFVNLPPNQAFSLILATDAKLANATFRDAQLCRPGTLDPTKVNGKIVSCIREGKIKSVAEGQEALSAGAQAMLLGNQKKNGKTTLAEPHVLSTVNNPSEHGRTKPSGFHITAMDDEPIKSGVTIKLSPARTSFGRKPAPVMASFSSRGPNKIQPSILKPDVTAPGVNILAAYSQFASASNLLADGRRGFKFNVLQGTSMSCPHVAGIAGLLRTLHPNWSPAAIKSAIMTTATTRDNTNSPIQDAFDKKLATPFAYGSGHVQPDLAVDPGLVYDLSLTDYLNFLCASGYDQQLISALNFNRTFICSGSHSVTDLNYPSITLPNLGLKAITITRTVTNVGPPSTYTANAQLPGYNIAVVPNSLTFKKIGEKKTFQVTVQARSVTKRGDYQFGKLQWTDGKHIVRSPITVRRK
ncbi:serine-type endopeptidase [Spatholobus suberectus]|nr:serine-type endopeptidase [Spatholobus suberectus]